MNLIASHSLLLDLVAQVLTVSQLLQGVASVTVLWYLWFATDDVDARARLPGGIVAAAGAGFLSRVLQIVLPTHPRPLHTETLGFVMGAGVAPEMLNHFNSSRAPMVPSSSACRSSSAAIIPGRDSRRSHGRQLSISPGSTRAATISSDITSSISRPAGGEFVPRPVCPPPGQQSVCSGTDPPIVVLSDGAPVHVSGGDLVRRHSPDRPRTFLRGVAA